MILWLIVFMAGAILMSLEIVGSRVLAPYFGGSIFVWGSLIGVFLTALSSGYYLGGKVADLLPRAWLLGVFLLLGALLIFLIPLAFPFLCQAIATRDFGPRFNPLIATTCLFFLPSLMMGAVSPFAIKLAASSLAELGGVAGTLYAISTIGSVVGTLGTAFYLIPALGTRAILYLLAISLCITAILAFAFHLKTLKRPLAACLLFPLILVLNSSSSMALASSAEQVTILLERDSAYHHIWVYDAKGYRFLKCDNVWHGQMPSGDIYGEGLAYTNYFDLGFLFKKDIKKVLFIGLGSGTGPKRFFRNYPEVQIEVAEVDPVIVQIAKQYFGVNESERLKIHVQDGRMFLFRSQQKYDLIVLDAYYRDNIPFFLATKEFFQLAKEHLTPGGVLVNNVIGTLEGSKNKIFRSIYRTESVVFDRVYVFPVWLDPWLAGSANSEQLMNLMLVAVNSAEDFSKEQLIGQAQGLQGKAVKDPYLVKRASAIHLKEIPTSDVPVLTDDYAPVDALIHLW